MLRKRRGQSILEYILVLTAIVGVLVWAAATFIKPAVEQGLTDATTAVGIAADKLPSEEP